MRSKCLCDNVIDHTYRDFVCPFCHRSWKYQDNPNGRYYTSFNAENNYQEKLWIDEFRSA